jgi:hypothetical protein
MPLHRSIVSRSASLACGLVVALALAATLTALGCGGSGDRDGNRKVEEATHRFGVAIGDTVRVESAGQPLVIPAPPGMVDLLTVTSQERPTSASGDQIAGFFLPRDRLEAVLGGAHPKDLSVSASVLGANTPSGPLNASRFESMRAAWTTTGSRITDPDARRIAEALATWKGGAQQELDDPLGHRGGDTMAVAVDHLGSYAVQLLSVGHNLPTDDAPYDIHSTALVLVRGRILSLMWTRRGSFSVRALNEVSDDIRRWADAVVAANP